jgi:Protein of unknown function (DUF3179)
MSRAGGRGGEPAGVSGLAAALMAVVVVMTACASGHNPAERSPADVGHESNSPEPSPLVDPDAIVPGGPPPDGIPPIDHPRFLPAAKVRFLAPNEPVLSVELRGQAKAYPLRIMVWHEIVNDTVGGTPVAVTYCPLCNTGITFVRPVIDGKLLDFGTSGKLYNSNLVMYDRQTNSYWPQALGEAVTGPLTGTKLRLVATQVLSWRDWQSAHPDGLVLSERTGFARAYGTNPYGGYDQSGFPFLFSGKADRRLPLLTYVLGVDVNDDFVAFPFPTLQHAAVRGHAAVDAVVGGGPVVVLWEAGTVSAVNASSIPDSKDIGAAMAFDRRVGGRVLTFEATTAGPVDQHTGSLWDITGRAVSGPLAGTRLRPVLATNSFWFDWAAFHPDTRIYGRPATGSP